MKKTLVAAVLSVIALVGVYWAALVIEIPALQNRALFGDMFGGIAALFSGLAFAGMIYALTLQTEELSKQREALDLMKEQYLESTEAQKKLIDKQMLTAQIIGCAAIVQGLYQFAAAHGANAGSHKQPAIEAERELRKLMEKAGWVGMGEAKK